MMVALYIIGSLAACYVVYVFGYGIIIAQGAEYEWTRGRRIRGSRAVLLGVAMMLSLPLLAAIAWALQSLNMLNGFWSRASLAAILSAVLYCSALRTITRKLDAADE